MPNKKFIKLFLFLLCTISLPVHSTYYDQKLGPYDGASSGTTATGGTIGAAATSAGGTPMGASNTTGTGGTIGVTIDPNSPVSTTMCINLSGKKICGTEARDWCREYPNADECTKLTSEINTEMERNY